MPDLTATDGGHFRTGERADISEMDISVIVPTYRRPDDLRHCLEALVAQTGGPAEVVVLTRDTDEPSRAIARSFNGRLPLRIIEVDEPGQVAALNRGLATVKTPLIAFTDDDARPRADWLERIVSHFADPTIGAVGGRDVIHDGDQIIAGRARTVGRVLWFGRMIGNHHLDGKRQEVQFIKGANMSYRREALLGFDMNLAGDVRNDLHASLTVHRSGMRVLWDPEVVVDHVPGSRFGEDGRQQRSFRAIADDLHNLTYSLLSLLPRWQKPIALAYGVLIGTSSAPGPLLLPVALFRTRRDGPAIFCFRAGAAGRLRGVRTYMRTKGNPRFPSHLLAAPHSARSNHHVTPNASRPDPGSENHRQRPPSQVGVPGRIARRARIINKGLFLELNHDPLRCAFIAGSGRGGTTWLAETIARQCRSRLLFEPFHPRWTPVAESLRLFSFPTEDNAALEEAVRRVISGRVRMRQIDNVRCARFARSRIVKDIHAVNLLPWIRARFPDIPAVLVLRHPIATALSRSRATSFYGLGRYLDTPAGRCDAENSPVANWLPIYDHYRIHGEPLVRVTAEWCVENVYAVESAAEFGIDLTFYETNVLEPMNELARVAEYCRSALLPEGKIQLTPSKVRNPSATDWFNNAAAAQHSQTWERTISQWTIDVPKSITSQCLNVLRDFGLDSLYSDDPMPTVGNGRVVGQFSSDSALHT
jgi:GT2 family glycosyltransferase